MDRIAMPAAERDMVRFLIGRHLALSETLNSRDLEDLAVIESLAHSLETVERLKALTLLTYGDISAVNPGAMTPWRRSQLWRLYLLTYNELTRELQAGTNCRASGRFPGEGRIPRRISDAPICGLTVKRISTCIWRWRRRRPGAEVAIDVRKLEGVYRLTLVAADRPFLFASVAGTLSSFGMNILKAEAFANRRGTVLDTFHVSRIRTARWN